MLSATYIRRLEGDKECLDALAWLAERGARYPTGGFTPPLTLVQKMPEPTRFAALSLRIGTLPRPQPGSRVARIDCYDGTDAATCEGSDGDIARGSVERVFTSGRSGWLFVTSGKRRHALDTWLDSQGPLLVAMGYSLQPMLSSGSVGWLIIRKGRHKWTVTYYETATGAEVSGGLALARTVGSEISTRNGTARSLYAATSAAQSVYLSSFGTALAPTVGMTALRAARRYLPPDFRKWRPAPLLVAMERLGRGYRGGLTYAVRFRGKAVQIDVTRQYTYALAHELPRTWVFGRFPGFHSLAPGVYVCRVRSGGTFPYPVGVWSGPDVGFVLEAVPRGEYVCVLHSPEIRALVRAGWAVWPSYGYTADSTFTLADYVSSLQNVLTNHGRDSPVARLTKPLGNYVYGKMAQNPEQTELLYSEDDHRPDWYPYSDEFGNMWDNVWERKTVRYSASQHIDVAAYLTSIARAQVIEAWLRLEESGSTVLRAHTDSLTVDRLPPSFRLSDGDEIGGWRIEKPYADTVIAGANAYATGGTPHLAGVSEPTYEMIERMHDGEAVATFQRIRKPRRGFDRGEETVERTLRATSQ